MSTFVKPEIQSRHPWENRIKKKYSSRYKYAHNSVANPIFPAPKTKEEKLIKFTVIGNRVAKDFIYCMYLTRRLHKSRKHQFEAPLIKELAETEWLRVWSDLKRKYGGPAYSLKSQVAVLKDGAFLGGKHELRQFVNKICLYNLHLDFCNKGHQRFANFIASSNRSYVYMHISINDDIIGCLIFMLYTDLVPLTCQNFIRLCELTKHGYSGSPIHRIVQDCWIQCGGFNLKASADLSFENHVVPLDRRGVLAMANDGRHRQISSSERKITKTFKDSIHYSKRTFLEWRLFDFRNKDCSTQFFVLLQPALWMNKKYVAFGQLIEGESTLSKIESIPTWYQSPTLKIIIDSAGVLRPEGQQFKKEGPTNCNTKNYIEGHIEDLVVAGNIFYEELLEKVYEEIELKMLLEDLDIKEFKSEGNEIAEHQEYNMEMCEIDEEFCDVKMNTPVTSEAKIPSKLFYLSLTDVPYPGEVDSIFNLQRFLRGGYCLKSDVQKRSIQKQQKELKPEDYRSAIDILLDSILTVDADMFDIKLNDEETDIVRKYIKENTDSVSFSGSVINKIASTSLKTKDVEDTFTGKKTGVLSDEELRYIRVVNKEVHNLHNKNVSICVPTIKIPHGVVRRRQTGFVHPEDIASLLGETVEEEEEDNVYDNFRLTSNTTIELAGKDRPEFVSQDDIDSFTSKTSLKKQDNSNKKGGISSDIIVNPKTGTTEPDNSLPKKEEPQKTSVLKRLYNSLGFYSDIESATLKNFKPLNQTPPPNNYLLTNGHHIEEFNAREKCFLPKVPSVDYSIDFVLHLQHGDQDLRKISTDYVKTIGTIEHRTQKSLGSLEYSKKRPQMSVKEYQLKNLKYREMLMTPQRTTAKKDSDVPRASK